MADGTITAPTIPQGLAKATAGNYTTLSAIYEKLNKPDYRDKLANIFGNQQVSGINGLLRMVGASKAAGMADSVNWWEAERLHIGNTAVSASTAVTTVASDPVTLTFASAHKFILRDTLLLYTVADGSVRPERVQVTSVPSSTTVVVYPYKPWAAAHLADAIISATKFSAEFGQGTDQPTDFLASDATLRNNTYYILKTMFSVTGSQMTNIDWMNGLWYHNQEKDFRKRTEDYDEMFAILGDKLAVTATGLAGAAEANANGSEGIFSAIEDRGINYENYIETVADLDRVIRQLDKQAGVGEYAFYVNRTQDQFFDNMLAQGNTAPNSLTSGVNEQYNVFGGNKQRAVDMGFASAIRSSYTFHKHDYKILNDPQLLGAAGAGYYKGIMIPMMSTRDAKTGASHPILEINYKGAEGYSREMESWRDGGVPMAGFKSNRDSMEFHYRCEKNVIVRGANNCVLFAGGTGA